MAQIKSGSTVNGEPIVEDAPNDGKTYVRKNGEWVEVDPKTLKAVGS